MNKSFSKMYIFAALSSYIADNKGNITGVFLSPQSIHRHASEKPFWRDRVRRSDDGRQVCVETLYRALCNRIYVYM